MKIKLITGSSGNAASAHCVADIVRESQSKKQTIIVITPENHTMKVEEEIAKAHSQNAFANIEITNFSRLFKKLKKSKTPVLSKEMEVMLIRKIIYENQSKLKCFSVSAKRTGFAEEVQTTISQLKQSGITPLDLPKNLSASLGSKLKDIFLIYDEYENFLKTGFFDSIDKLTVLKDMVEHARIFNGNKVYLLGFDSLTERGFQLFKQIVKTAAETTVSCIFLENESENELYDKLMKIALDTGAELTKIGVGSGSLESKHIASNFNFEATKTVETEKIMLSVAASIEEEVTGIAEQITSEIRKGARFQDIEVSCSDIETHKSTFKKIFGEFKIPYFLDQPSGVLNHPYVTQIISALKMVQKNFPFDEVINFCKNPLTGIEKEEQMVFENYCRKFGITNYSFLEEFKFGIENSTTNFEIAERVRRKIIEATRVFETKNTDKIKNITTKIKKFQVLQKIEQKLDEYALKQKETDVFESKISIQVKSKLDELLDSYEKLLGAQEVSIEEFISIFQSGLGAVKVHVVPIQIDSVLLSSISQSRHSFCKILFVVGASESKLPATKKDCGIITDDEIAEISGKIQLKLEPTIQTLNKRERQTIFELLQNPSEKLFISYAKFNGNEEQKPSYVQRMLQRLFTRKGVPLQLVENSNLSLIEAKERLYQKITNPKQSEKVLFDQLRKKKQNISSKGMFDFVTALFHTISGKMTRKCQALLQNDNQPTKIENTGELFFEKGKTSISELESYFNCPYKHFVEYGLRAREREDAKIKAMDVGNLLHAVLERLTKETILHPELDPESDKFTDKVKTILTEVVMNEKYQAEINSFMLRALKDEACRLSYAIVVGNQMSNFKPVEAEVRFGEGEVLSGIKLGKTNTMLEGKIDRVDRWQNFVRIVDYKTGKVDLSPAELYHGKKIQLFAYLLAFENQTDKIPVGVFYLPIKNTFSKDSETNILSTYRMQGYFRDEPGVIFAMDKTLNLSSPKSVLVNVSLSSAKENVIAGNLVIKPQKHIVSGETLKDLTRYVKKLSEKGVEEIQNGNIKASPIEKGDSSPCSYCDLKCICGIDQNPKNKRKQFEVVSTSQITRSMK